MTEVSGGLARLRAEMDEKARAAQRQAEAVRDLCGVVARLSAAGWPVAVEVQDAPLRVWLSADLALPVAEAAPLVAEAVPVVVIEDDGIGAGDAPTPVSEENSGVVVDDAAPELLPKAGNPAAAGAVCAAPGADVAVGSAAAGGVSSPPPVAATNAGAPRAGIWTREELFVLLAGRAARVKMSVVAGIVGRNTDACWTRHGKLQREGVTLAGLRAELGAAAVTLEADLLARAAEAAPAPVTGVVPRAPNWTVVEELQLLAGLVLKVAMDPLARHIGREKTACYARLRMLRAQHVSLARLREEVGPAAVEIEAAVAALGAVTPPPQEKKPWTAEDEAEVARLRAEGMTVAQAAAAIGRTRSSVSVRLSERATGKRRAPPPAAARGVPAPEPVAEPSVAVAAVAAVAPVPADLGEVRAAAPVVVEVPPLGASLGGDLHRRLDALEREGRAAGWTPALDLALLKGLTRGHRLGFVAQDIGMDARACKVRFAALVPQADFAAQTAVLKALAERVAMARQVAA